MVGLEVTGAECVNVYTELGVPVAVVVSQDPVLPYKDTDAALVLEVAFAERSVRLFKNRCGIGYSHRRWCPVGDDRRPYRRRQPRPDEH